MRQDTTIIPFVTFLSVLAYWASVQLMQAIT